jgi:vancomycin resistance protein YoaR
MEKITEQIKEIIPIDYKNHWKRNTLIISGAFLFLALVVCGGAFAYRDVYENKDKIFPGVYLGDHHMGGLTRNQAKDFIENFNDRIATEGLDFNFPLDKGVHSFNLSAVSSDESAIKLVKLNSDSSVDRLMSIGHSGNLIQDLWQPVYIRFFGKKVVNADVVIENKLISNLESYMLAFGDPPRNANVKVTNLSPLAYSIEPEKAGFIFDYTVLKNNLQNQLSALSLAPISISKKEFKPDVLTSDLDVLVAKLPEILNYGDLGLTYTDPQTNVKRDWSVGPNIYTNWLETRREKGEPIFALNKEKVKTYLESLRPFIDTTPEDAKFVMENDRVKEFQASQTGVSLDDEKTFNDLDTVFQERNYSPTNTIKVVTISVMEVKPAIQMSDVNNLGIMEVVGTGYSTFKDSHNNRIKNIANAVKRLNGVLIKPGEEFSANKYAGPYTTANGFLPEQVIKGNKIIPEVGGGMCQIGTTLFRMAMNTGLPITQRRNHSLVVSYYADPVNGNPGTDATLYEPSLDLKFVNDTGNYMLLETSIDYEKQQLVFTLWGKGDGRKGSYTHPVVSKWIPAGAPQVIVVNTLKPGEKKCQNGFRGAVASFVYTIITPSGEKIERVFDSYYRPLPQICTVGASAEVPAETTPGTPDPNIPIDVSDNA